MLFAAAGFLIGSLDDLLVDVIWLCRSLWRRVFIYTRHEVMTLTNLPPARQPGVTAIFVPVWAEAGVIGAMLLHCLTSWNDDAFSIFVGCTPNDPATILAVLAVADRACSRSNVIGPAPGHTQQGDYIH